MEIYCLLRIIHHENVDIILNIRGLGESDTGYGRVGITWVLISVLSIGTKGDIRALQDVPEWTGGRILTGIIDITGHRIRKDRGARQKGHDQCCNCHDNTEILFHVSSESIIVVD